MLTFVADATDLRRFATIDRIGRDADGELSGFQRPQIAAHILEIKDYLNKEDAVLPNPIVVAFTSGVAVKERGKGLCDLTINLAAGPPGLVVDGQQRLSALSQLEGKRFDVFVSALICPDESELRRQFVLVNNTRPLPKSLIYELLPTVDGLPHRLSNRALAAELTARLNYDRNSSLRGKIHQHTNPNGIISDTAMQRVIMNSLSDGMMREFMRRPGGKDRSFELISEFYRAVQDVFSTEWKNHKPATSRLVHGAGIVALGYTMETLALLDGARSWDEFTKGLGCLEGRTAWTKGEWRFSGGDTRHWKAIQNVNRDIVRLAAYLLAIVRDDIKRRRSAGAASPSLIVAAE